MTDQRKTEPRVGADEAGYDAGVVDIPAAGAPRRRPWQLLMVGEGSDQIDAAACAKLARILDLFPDVSHLVVQTTAGSCQMSRDFPSNYMAEVDRCLVGIFQGNPAVTGIAFPGTSSRPGHTATPDDPYWSPEGKASADIMAALRRGEIGFDEANAQLRQLFAS